MKLEDIKTPKREDLVEDFNKLNGALTGDSKEVETIASHITTSALIDLVGLMEQLVYILNQTNRSK